MLDNQIDRRVYNVENDLQMIKLAIAKHSAQNDAILASINEIKMTMQAQRGFVAGLKQAGAATIAIGTLIVGALAFFFDHIFGKN
jgi:hypothetical protein